MLQVFQVKNCNSTEHVEPSISLINEPEIEQPTVFEDENIITKGNSDKLLVVFIGLEKKVYKFLLKINVDIGKSI